jgi:myo-inositol 2-dehydrogenase/D-chiro-inositol 1-dehydrogenase
MNILLLGDGEAERDWASWLLGRDDHHPIVAFPGFASTGDERSGIPCADDLDAALATAGIDAAIVGGPPAFRMEALRRAAANGWPVICLHPPGPDSEAYYQVSLSRAETGAVIVPDLPLRLVPGIAELRGVLERRELGELRAVRFEGPAENDETDLIRVAFARRVDLIRSLLGEIVSLTATGEPSGLKPDLELIVQLRAGDSGRGEVRIWSGLPEFLRVSLIGAEGSQILEFDPRFDRPARLIRRPARGEPTEVELEPWDPHEAVMEVLERSLERRGSSPESLPSPNLNDGIRAMEIAEAVVRSLRRGRTIDLHYEPISEEANFKSVMTSTGCLVLLGILVLLPLSLVGPPLGLPWTLYLGYLIPPALIVFVLLQSLRLAVRRKENSRNV